MKMLALIFRSFRPLVTAINETVRINFASASNEGFSPDNEWFRLAPYGDFPVTITDPANGRNRRVTQRVDEAAADAIIASFNSVVDKIARGFRGLPIYVGHADDPQWRKENPGARAEAVGRIKELQKRSDGIYARRALNDEGKRLLSGDAAPYDAHSPHWGMIEIAKNTFRPVELYSTALTNQPNMPGMQIGLNEAELAAHSAMKNQILALLAALGRNLAADSTDEQLAAAINETVAVATKHVGNTALLATAMNDKGILQSQLMAEQAKVTAAVNDKATIATQLATERTARAELVVTTAVNEGRITQAQRAEWLGKFTVANADFAAVSADLAKVKKAINTHSRVKDIGARKEEINASNSKITAINEAVAAEKKATGCTHDQAFAKLRQTKPELFAEASE